jgi:L-alanine-DL-glutamate epimerase-like enolase superfamily enzyme
MPRRTDIRVDSISFEYEDFRYRTPIKFGGTALDRVTLLNVQITVRTETGTLARGFGSMPLGNVWSFPSRALSYDDTLGAMKAVAAQVARVYGEHRGAGHPIDLFHELEPEFFHAADVVTRELKLAEPIPPLCTLVAASPFDAAVHDAFGKVHGRNCYHTYGPEFLDQDLGHYLGAEFAGLLLERFIRKQPQERMPLYHLIGALDPITEADVKERIGDGLPESLPDWIRADGLTHLKIKLNGDNLGWDVERVIAIDRAAEQTQAQRGISRWHYSLDFNERCANVGYLLEFLAKVRESRSAGFDRIQYIEQPTARDLRGNRSNLMHEAARLRPVVIDESLIDLESLQLAREQGYTGAALKACKGQSPTLLLAAAAQKYGMFLCVQDLTCPGASLIHSAGLAAHVPGVAAIESNARQYCPAANEPWAERFPGIFRITDGTMETGILTGLGLGAAPANAAGAPPA